MVPETPAAPEVKPVSSTTGPNTGSTTGPTTASTTGSTPIAPRRAKPKSTRGSDTGLAVWHAGERLARWVGRHLSLPRTRTFLFGTALILVAALFVGHSFWTAPLVIIGIVMIVVAWVGSRIEGRFAIEWSEMGTGFEMHARFKPASVNPQQLASGVVLEPKSELVPEHDVIEGEAHTIELPIDELRALVAAIEQAAPPDRSRDADADPATAETKTPAPVSRTGNGAAAVRFEIPDEQ